ncbi:MAG: HEPN domain-containing protein [Deltaproteobacteria bacterium]|nr:HEPN domain-containing protein [Deltaproteobacteria bacterium]
MPERSKDWINQAVRDLKAAEGLVEKESFEWACFIAQQAAEKALKAVFQRLNAVAWGHSVFDLLRVLSERTAVDEDFLNCARILDKYYIPTRYPNGFDSGSPYEYFTRRDAEDAIVYSRKILEFCQGILA